MRIIGPDRYRLDFDARKFEVTCPAGTKKFSGIATSRLPKLYVISVEQKPIYVGVTRQSVRNRLRFGWNAVGAGGYYGYAWRHKHTSAVLDIWCHVDASGEDLSLDIETVEAEVVYLIRCSGCFKQKFISIRQNRNIEELRRKLRPNMEFLLKVSTEA
jgi:hypothetical protein